MPSYHETFFTFQSYAVVGYNNQTGFPSLTYNGLKKLGKTVYPVDPGSHEIEGDRAYVDLEALPEQVDAVILEVPREETAAWVEKIAQKGIKDLWIHMNRETDEALQLVKTHGLNARTGTCAVMYVTPGFSIHSIHKLFRKLSGRY